MESREPRREQRTRGDKEERGRKQKGDREAEEKGKGKGDGRREARGKEGERSGGNMRRKESREDEVRSEEKKRPKVVDLLKH